MQQGRLGQALFRHSSRDATLVGLAGVYGALVVTVPSAPLIAIGFWWIANTVSHNFIHLAFFKSRAANSVFSVYLSLLLGLPQTLWRDRHLAHHADRPWRFRWSRQLVSESLIVAALWGFLASLGFAVVVTFAAGISGGLALSWLQGHFEHVRGTVSHYGRLYNFAFFNDGYHVEHHARPGVHWSKLSVQRAAYSVQESRWPAVLRWLETSPLNGLERIALKSRALQRFMVSRHVPAFRKLLREVQDVRRVTIVGGGLFPRTALVLKQLLPHAEITIVDKSADSLSEAMPFLEHATRIVKADFAAELCMEADLVVVPLAFVGDRKALYASPPARAMLIHDWIWNRRGKGAIVSALLLKRLNLVRA